MKMKDWLKDILESSKQENINFEFTEDIDNKLILIEAVTPEQKEKGQREIWKIENNVLNKVQSYFNKKWSNPSNLKNKAIEKERLEDLKKYFNSVEPSEKAINFYKEKMGTNPKFPINVKDYGSSPIPAGVNGYGLNTFFNSSFDILNITGNGHYLNGFDFTKENAKKFESIIWKFIIMHEQGHLYNYLIQAIENGRVEPVGTASFQFSKKDRENVNNSEAGANAYALDNMYRKDRREFLKNSEMNQTHSLNRLKDAYTKDLDKKSKTLNKTLDSIRKEKSHFNY